MKNRCFTHCILFSIFLLYTLPVFSQNTGIKNLNLKVVNDRVQIHYDLKGSPDKASRHKVDLLFVDENYNYYQPEYVTGDIGANIPEGKNKKIVWDVLQDDIRLSRRIRPEILVDFKRRGGPDNAFLSLLMPGLGDFFVEDLRKIDFKPYYRSALTAGLIGLGIKALDERIPSQVIRHEGDDDSVEDQDYRNTSNIEYRDMKPWLFEGDGELFMGLGVMLWLYDIYWVYKKGSENRAINSVLRHTSVAANQNGLQIAYKWNF